MKPQQVLTLGVSVDLRVMAMKGYFTLYTFPELESHHQIVFNIMPICLNPAIRDTVMVI